MENNSSYYVNIPGLVLEDRTITPYAKLLFGIVSSLCNIQGFCFASSDYLAERLGVTDRAIRNYVIELLNAGHIRVEKSDSNKRKIFLTTKVVSGKKPEKQIKINAEQTFHVEKTEEQTFQNAEQTFQTSGTNVPEKRNERSDNNIKDITKEKNKDITKDFEKSETPEHLKRDNDPFAISFDPKNASIVFDELKKYTIKRFRTKPSPDPLSCSEIASRCIAENENDLREEIRYKLEIYEYCQFFSEKFAPAPKRILQAWDQLIDTALPEHKRRIKTSTRSEPIQDDDAPIMEFLEDEPISEDQKKRNLEEIDKVIKKSKL